MANRSRSTKQKKIRRTKAEIEALKDSIVSVLHEIKPATARQVFCPTKRTGNKHAKGFIGDSVELDAIPPAKLRELIESCITQHPDPTTHNALVAAEESERETLAAFIQTFSNRRDYAS
jgi:hypothetical protein